MKIPKVSVLTPIYNTKESWLRECIESILNQTFKDFEFIILNDSPWNKELEKIVKSYNDSRIKYFENKENLGITKSRNKLLDLAKGEYIAVFDHDDISLPQRLEKEVNFLDNNKQYGVVSCNYTRIPKKDYTSKHPNSNFDIKNALCEKMICLHTGMMIRKSILIENNIKYEEKYSPAEDYMLCARLIEYTMFYNLKDILIYYRMDNNNTTNLQNLKMQDADLLIRNFIKNKYPILKENIHTKTTYWHYLFSFIPFIKVEKTKHKIKYALFGLIPLLKIAKRKINVC